jgi:cell division protein FtsL
MIAGMDFLGMWNYLCEAVRTHPFNFITLLFALVAIAVSIIALRHSRRLSAAAEKQVEEARGIRQATEERLRCRRKPSKLRP